MFSPRLALYLGAANAGLAGANCVYGNYAAAAIGAIAALWCMFVFVQSDG